MDSKLYVNKKLHIDVNRNIEYTRAKYKRWKKIAKLLKHKKEIKKERKEEKKKNYEQNTMLYACKQSFYRKKRREK